MIRRLFAILVVPTLLGAQAQPVPHTSARPGWKCTMDSVRTVVGFVRAGRSLLPGSWPGGARVAEYVRKAAKLGEPIAP